ncbi:MAG: HK97 gp10 family phage protein [Polaromonas sp.]
MTVRFSLDTSALSRAMEGIDGSIKDAVRPAAQAAAQVIYDAAKSNVGKIRAKTGNLASSIYQAYKDKTSTDARAMYDVSWNPKKAPHAGLVEYGHIQRYQSYVGKDGQWHTMVRPEMRGKKKPGRRASMAVKDAYYVLRKGGPVQVAAQPFMRPAKSAFPAAREAAAKKILEAIRGN